MIRVQMTRPLKDRPPKIAGLLTVRQLITTAIAIAISIPVFKLTKGMDIAVRILLSFVVAGPVIFYGWMPQSEASPRRFFGMIRSLFYGTKIRTHEGNNAYYRKKEVKDRRIKRYRSYKGYN